MTTTTAIEPEYQYYDVNFSANIQTKRIQYKSFHEVTISRIEATRRTFPKFRHYTGRISLINQSPLPFEERVKTARAKIKRMNDEEKWQLIEQSFGMWESYPEDWLTRMREGTLDYRYSTESQITIHAISR